MSKQKMFFLKKKSFCRSRKSETKREQDGRLHGSGERGHDEAAGLWIRRHIQGTSQGQVTVAILLILVMYLACAVERTLFAKCIL